MNCKTCNGLGVIPVQTGQTAETYGEYNIDCLDCSGHWYCRTCRREVEPEGVTFEENHDERAGGCGESVYECDKWHNPIDGNRLIYCCFPDCGCGAARMCSAENGSSFGANNLCREKGGEI